MTDFRRQIREVNKQGNATATRKTGFTADEGALKILRNTYLLLSATLVFSAVCAFISMAIGMPYLGLWMLLPYFACLYMVERNKHNSSGLFWVFALTGFMGLTAGPIISSYIAYQGYQIVLMALAGTGAIFFAASSYVTTTGKNLSGWTGFLVIGMIVAFVAAIANFFLQIQGLSLAISSAVLFIASGIIMVQISAIVNGGERSYISATVTLFVMLYNVFFSLLHLLGFANSD